MMNLSNSIYITVLTPVYNAESFIRETIDSVLCQTFRAFEFLLLDDGSTDKSRDIISTYPDQRIRYVCCEHDFIGTINKGLEIARGKYIALLDHDDLMMPKRLQIQYDYMESHPDMIACGGYMHSFGESSQLMKVPLPYHELMRTMVYRCPMLNPTGFVRKDAIMSYEIRYQRGYSFAADFKLWSDLAKVGPVTNIPQVLTLYRTSPQQTGVVFLQESMKGAREIQQEMVNYFLSTVEEGNEFYALLDEKLLPAFEDLNAHAFFTANTYFSFWYEVINGLYKKDALGIKPVNAFD